ncbi:[histone H3]-lysine-36 demethylase [Handroanthus impetiginosus]|uniref:Bifunctional lysine-specific demethylase and histidyl-hydroxylase n=1 Tax=Handroanthus impetiginosus TaxID=429701 RepID=A0A2G9GTJ3_9LAMI|nr:[histone H3]-lysine-36 demethylase [Handroanthus impetiginosus]
MLKHFISCLAIASDELDILHVIKEIKHHLGNPIIYNQDIRVVKTESGERELHYFQEQSGSSSPLAPHILSLDDILKCEEAFKEGYSIALRGMEFRYQTIAAIANGLASLFGQPSAGVNMYLTPANSQGLARHSDDHCVFVCQLIGTKRWMVFPRPNLQLPRLYEPSGNLDYSEDESREVGGCRQFLLKEGDVLYVPRGFPHEARTGGDDDETGKNATGFSLHLTLAIEIEPPFEWEGFMHIALFCWDKKSKAKSVNTLPCSLHKASVELLHIAIKLICDLDSAFRKACLVGATPSSPDTKDFLCNNQTTIFKYLISRIATESNFSDAVNHLEATLQKNEDPLECVRWIKYLKEEGDEIERSQSISSEDNRYLFDLLIHDRDFAKGVFMEVKSRFCDEVEFGDVEECYKVVLEKYRMVRKQYTNGMLSLHSAILNEHGITSC